MDASLIHTCITLMSGYCNELLEKDSQIHEPPLYFTESTEYELLVRKHVFKGVIWCVVTLFWVLQADCAYKIPEVAKTKVSKPKRYLLSKLRFCHAPLKRLNQTCSHMSTSWCGNICIRVVSVTTVMLKQPSQGEAVNSNAFYGWPFREIRIGGNSDIALTI